ncbi:DNA polymerase III subunit delta' [Rhodoferax sp.]|uniref:DNA polymerase III subunit delta' n=1 Tax=Rhodoferax sp. TaxID=50421 RepID=UPI00274BA549|nr:DNA polymerase III subunit delta' [Rhodoferax sp.]
MSEPVLAPWIASQARQLLSQRGHAWLLAGPTGLGQYSLAMALVRAWLCEQASEAGACGVCGSCHAVDVRTHADLCVLMPETTMLELNWPLSERAQNEIDDKKRKASKEIRVEAMRDAVEFSQRTSARGRGKAVLVFPAERMNTITANALLKTLEEPPGDVKFVLASGAAHQLLPTIRSRCLGHTMVWPDAQSATAWVEAQGLSGDDATVLLRAAGGRPDDALAFAQSGRSAKAWRQLPAAMARGDTGWVKDWSAAQIVDALQKLCHDILATQMGAMPRFFEAADLPTGGSLAVLTGWSKTLTRASRTVEHPFNPGLLQETLVSQAQSALNSKFHVSLSV